MLKIDHETRGRTDRYSGYYAVLSARFGRPIDLSRRWAMIGVLRRLLAEDNGQDIAEYAVMLAVILVIVVGTIRLIGSNANKAFSAAASSIQ